MPPTELVANPVGPHSAPCGLSVPAGSSALPRAARRPRGATRHVAAAVNRRLCASHRSVMDSSLLICARLCRGAATWPRCSKGFRRQPRRTRAGRPSVWTWRRGSFCPTVSPRRFTKYIGRTSMLQAVLRPLRTIRSYRDGCVFNVFRGLLILSHRALASRGGLHIQRGSPPAPARRLTSKRLSRATRPAGSPRLPLGCVSPSLAASCSE